MEVMVNPEYKNLTDKSKKAIAKGATQRQKDIVEAGGERVFALLEKPYAVIFRNAHKHFNKGEKKPSKAKTLRGLLDFWKDRHDK